MALGMVALKHQVLSLAERAWNTLHVLAESHVEHAVGFVEHEMLDFAQVDVPLLVQVEQAAGVATNTSTPRRRAFTCGLCPTPPKMTVE